MARGKGGRIKNWSKISENFWSYTGNKEAKVAVGGKTRKGYPVKFFGKDVKSRVMYKPTKRKAEKSAADIRRKNTDI